ncbi:MAG: transporter related [Acidobacteria bacterium]|nr:transporter related [Acidobacteriota bacterium]
MHERADEPSLGRLIARTLLSDRRALVRVGALTLLAQLVVLPLPFLSRAAIDRAIGDEAPSMLAAIALALAGVALFDAVATWCRSRAALAVEARLELGVSRTLLERVVGMPFRVLLAKTSGEVLQSFDGMGVARELLAMRAAAAVFDLVSAAAFGVLMFAMAPGGAMIVCGGAVVAALVSVVFAPIQSRHQQQETDASVAQRNAVIEILRSIARVKAAAAEWRFVERWRACLGRQMSAGVRRERAALWPEASAMLVRDGVRAAILIWGALRAHESGVTVGSIVAFLQMATVMLAAVARLTEAWSSVVTAAPQLAAAREILALPPPPGPPRRSRMTATRIVVDEVTFRYRRDLPDVVRNASLTVEAGEVRRIEGPSGSGKSTLLRIIAGVLEPDRGSVRVAGDIMYLPQFARLFSGTLGENLTLLSAGAPLTRIRSAADEIGLGDLLRGMPAGYETMLQASGAGLSSGQRQLILLTGAAASERRILLLDEPMANLDPETQRRSLASRAFHDKTIVYASHTAAW